MSQRLASRRSSRLTAVLAIAVGLMVALNHHPDSGGSAQAAAVPHVADPTTSIGTTPTTVAPSTTTTSTTLPPTTLAPITTTSPPRTTVPKLWSVRPTTGSKSVYMIGDSLSQGTEAYMPGLAQAEHLGFEQDVALGRSTPNAIATLQTRAAKAPLPGVLVLAVGTNDSVNPGSFAKRVEQVLAIAGPSRCVTWVNIVRPGGWDALNAVLAREAATHPNLLIADWATLFGHHPEWAAKDGVHANSDGYKARARLIAVAMANCAGVPAAVPPPT